MAENRRTRRQQRFAVTTVAPPDLDPREHLSERGVLARNIRRIERQGSVAAHSYEFEAKLGDAWYRCRMPVGDWSLVIDGPQDSVPVGWWELNDMFNKD